MKKAVFAFFLLLFFFSPHLTQAQENTGLLDPSYQLLWGTNGRVTKFDTPLFGISEETSGTIYLLFSNGEFKEIIGNEIKVLEEAETNPAKIFQYQIGKRGKIATLRTDGTVEINFKALAEEGDDGYTKALNRQMAFSSEDGLWVIQEDASLYQWSKVENQWKFIIQDPYIRSIAAIHDALYAIREIIDGDQTYFEIGKLREVSLLGGGPSAKWFRLNFENIFKDPHTALRTLGFDGTHLVILTEKRHRPYDYEVTRVPLKAIAPTLNAAPYGLNPEPLPAEAAETTSFNLSKTPPSKAGLRLMTPKGMMCQQLKWLEEEAPETPRLEAAIARLETLAASGKPLPVLPIVDEAMDQMLGDLAAQYQYEMLIKRAKRSGKSLSLPETSEQILMRQTAVDTHVLTALEVLLSQTPEVRKLVLERLVDVLEATKRHGKRFLKP